MKRRIVLSGLAIGLFTFAGCVPTSNSVTVQLRNMTFSPIKVTLYYHSDQNVLESLLKIVGKKLEYTVPALGTESFTRDCDELQAIQIDKAKMQVVGDIGPSANSELFRDGHDFGCGDELTFTFTGNVASLNINFSN